MIDPSATVHPTAIVDSRAQIGAEVSIGPYSLIGPDVVIGARTRIAGHVVIEGHTSLGNDNSVYQFASLGSAPQDMKYAGEPTRLEIGSHNLIREFCSLNTGTVQDAGATRIGDHNWIMAYVHVAHDCQIGNRVILANNSQLAGHVHVGDHVVMGAFTGVHQFVHIGAHCMSGGGTMLRQDVPPFVMAEGNPASARGINSEGLRRRGFDAEAISAVRAAYRTLYRSGLTLAEARAALEKAALETPVLVPLVAFLAQSTRGIVR